MSHVYQLTPATNGERLRATPVDRRVLLQSRVEAEAFLLTLRRRACLGSTLKCFAGMKLVSHTVPGLRSKLICGARVYSGRHFGLFEEDAQDEEEDDEQDEEEKQDEKQQECDEVADSDEDISQTRSTAHALRRRSVRNSTPSNYCSPPCSIGLTINRGSLQRTALGLANESARRQRVPDSSPRQPHGVCRCRQEDRRCPLYNQIRQGLGLSF